MGWWIAKDGETWKVPDHWTFVRSKPTMFGFAKREVEKWTLADREPMLDVVLSRGWIRVRGEVPHRSFTFAVLDNSTLFNMREFLVRTKANTTEQILFEEVATGASWYKPAAWLLSDEALGSARNPRKPGRRPPGR